MKKKGKLAIKLGIGVVVVIIIGALIAQYVGGTVEKVKQSGLANYYEHNVEMRNLETFVRGSGSYQSFNVAKIKVEEGYKITKELVNDGDQVAMNQNLFVISNNEESKYIKAPIDGIFFLISNGEESSYQIYNTVQTGLSFNVAEADIAKLQIGMTTQIQFNAIEKNVEGSVSYISRVAENGSFKVRVSVPYSEDLKFGYNATVRIITSSIPSALCVPYEAIHYDDTGAKAFVVQAKELEKIQKNGNGVISEDMKTYVTLGSTDNEFVQISEGLKDGDKVLVESYE